MSQIEGPTPPPSDDPKQPNGTETKLVVPTPPASIEELGKMLTDGNVEEFNRRRPNSRLVFQGLDLHQRVLDGANLTACTFKNCRFRACSLNNANISAACFESSFLWHSSFNWCDGGSASFTNSEIESCKFLTAILTGAIFDRTSIKGTLFCDASMRKSHFQYSQIEGSDFEKIQAPDIQFLRCEVKGTTFSHARLSRSWLAQSYLEDTSFLNANMTDLRLTLPVFSGLLKLQGAIIPSAKFQEYMFDKATWNDGDVLKGTLNQNEIAAPDPLKSMVRPSGPCTLIDEIPGTNQELYTDAMKRLSQLVGLDEAKREVEELAAVLRINKQREHLGLPTESAMSHYVFSGPPGTGKTTVARILGDVLKSLGYLSKGQFIETDRSGLVGRYLGETAIKTQNIVESALGGVLFIDEAYALSPKNDMDSYAQEAVSTLLKTMEDKRKQFVVIAAGYGPEMRRFIDSNPGLQSRFSQQIQFKSFTPQALTEIFAGLMTTSAFNADAETTRGVTLALEMLKDKGDDHFGNARVVRNLLDKMARRQSMRLLKESGPMDTTRFSTFVFDDIPCLEMLNISTERFRRMLDKTPADSEKEMGVFIDPKLKFKGFHFPN